VEIYVERISRTGPRMRGRAAREGSGQMTNELRDEKNEAEPASDERHLDGHGDMGRSLDLRVMTACTRRYFCMGREFTAYLGV